MKSIRNIFRSLFSFAGFVAFLNLAHAQQTSFYNASASLDSATDLQTMLEIIESVPPVPFDTASQQQKLGTFWSVQFAPGSRTSWPPLPGNILGLPVWPIGDGNFLLDDRNVDYAAIQLATELAAAASPRMRMSMISSLSSSYAYGNPVYLTNFFVSSSGYLMTASFSIAGGTNFVPYDILMITNLENEVADWNWLGIGYTSQNYNFNNQPANQAFYILAKPAKTMTVGFGNDVVPQCDVPFGLTNALQVAGGDGQSIALLNNGTVVAWGDTNNLADTVPTNLVGVAMIAAGWNHNVALLTNGIVIAWGFNGTSLGWYLTDVPANLTNATVISAQALHSLALRKDGTVVAWGYSPEGETNIPSGLSNVVAIAAGGEHNLAVTSNGMVVAWGYNDSGQCNIPTGLSNVVDVAAGWAHSIAMRNDGTVVAWGDNTYGESSVPAGLSNVVAIAAGGDPLDGSACTLALKNDGTVTMWGESEVTLPLGGLNNVVAIAAGVDFALAIRTGPRTPVITLEPTDQYQLSGGNVSFTARGSGLYGVTYQWQTNGVNFSGATNSTLALTNVQTAQQVNYRAIVSDGNGSITSSNAAFTVVTSPAITSQSQPTNPLVIFDANVTLNVVISAPGQFNGFPVSYQWQFNGTNILDATSSNYTFAATDLGIYSVVISNAAGSTNASWQVRVLLPGSIWAWGENDDGETDVPALTNVSAIAAGEFHSVAVKDDETVVQWGYDWAAVPVSLTNAIAVAAGYEHSIALRSDGTVTTWGDASSLANVILTNLSGVKAVACGWDHNVALLTNGTVTAWGFNGALFGWHLTDVPTGLTNIVAIAANSLHSLALRTDGTIVAWGYSPNGETNVPAGLSNVVSIAAGGEHNLALKVDGTVSAWGYNGSGQCNVPSGLSNVMAIAAGWQHSVALRNDGTVVSWGDNSDGQTNTPTLNQVKLIAAGGNHTIAGIFSPLVQYSLDVTKDLLLIYNTNSVDSSTVKDYYLAHRPMVADANVFGIGYTNSASPGYYECISPSDVSSLILNPVASWLMANPTKRPQYVILFLDVPSRVFNYTYFPTNELYLTGGTNPSVSVRFRSIITTWQPFVTHINMDGTNDCISYINKLAFFGSNYAPGKLVIGANASGYDNTNYYLSYLMGFTNIGFNIAGYFSGGVHSGLSAYYPTDGEVKWNGANSWWLIHTAESFNGLRFYHGQGTFMEWYSSSAFGGTNYSSTPIGAVTSIDEPGFPGSNDPVSFFQCWKSGKNFAICAWNSRRQPFLQAVGDPFVQQ